MKILKMIGWEEEGVPTTTILPPSCYLFYILENHSTSYLSIWSRDKADIRVFRRRKICFAKLLTSLNFGYIVCTYCRTKNDNKKIRIVYVCNLNQNLKVYFRSS